MCCGVNVVHTLVCPRAADGVVAASGGRRADNNHGNVLDLCAPHTMLRLWARRGAIGATGAAGVAYASSPGFRRSVTFWSTVAPFFAEYQVVKARASWDQCSAEELDTRITAFHHRTAARAVDVILQLGGIYVKIGQFASTMGAGILEDAYIEALQPLQDGVPPRSLEEVSSIIEASVGQSMASLFRHFEPEPVGAASIAQAHRATLNDGREVIVKIQYPEVERLYEADFDNLEVVTRWLFPENLPLIHGLRKRHSAELDFRTEAANLREVRANLQRRGFEPKLVRIPGVPDDRLCTRHVLAMELLHGSSLATAIDAEMAEVAAALGLRSAKELRARTMRKVQQHFEEGGGAQRFIDVAETAAPLLRAYAATIRRLRHTCASLHRALVRWLAALGVASLLPPAPPPQPFTNSPRADLGRAIRTLVRVHGVAMLLDGVYNADPHPGNVLLLEDGRLGLIDYGMVGRLGPEERRKVARVTCALAAGGDEGKAAVVKEYIDSGYRACWHSGEPHGPDAIYRFATFHLDRINLAPVRVSRASSVDAGKAVGEAAGGTSQMMPVMTLFRSTLEHAVPDWVEQGRRLGGLLIGVGSQAGRPISLAHEWLPIAEELLTTSGASDREDPMMLRGSNARLRTHLTGLTA